VIGRAPLPSIAMVSGGRGELLLLVGAETDVPDPVVPGLRGLIVGEPDPLDCVLMALGFFLEKTPVLFFLTGSSSCSGNVKSLGILGGGSDQEDAWVM